MPQQHLLLLYSASFVPRLQFCKTLLYIRWWTGPKPRFIATSRLYMQENVEQLMELACSPGLKAPLPACEAFLLQHISRRTYQRLYAGSLQRFRALLHLSPRLDMDKVHGAIMDCLADSIIKAVRVLPESDVNQLHTPAASEDDDEEDLHCLLCGHGLNWRYLCPLCDNIGPAGTVWVFHQIWGIKPSAGSADQWIDQALAQLRPGDKDRLLKAMLRPAACMQLP